MNEMLDPGAVEIQYDAAGVVLVDTRDPQNAVELFLGASPSVAWPRWRFTYEEWDDFIERANQTRPPR